MIKKRGESSGKRADNNPPACRAERKITGRGGKERLHNNGFNNVYSLEIFSKYCSIINSISLAAERLLRTA